MRPHRKQAPNWAGCAKAAQRWWLSTCEERKALQGAATVGLKGWDVYRVCFSFGKYLISSLHPALSGLKADLVRNPTSSSVWKF